MHAAVLDQTDLSFLICRLRTDLVLLAARRVIAFILTLLCWLVWVVASFASPAFSGGEWVGLDAGFVANHSVADWHLPAIQTAPCATEGGCASQAGVLVRARPLAQTPFLAGLRFHTAGAALFRGRFSSTSAS